MFILAKSGSVLIEVVSVEFGVARITWVRFSWVWLDLILFSSISFDWFGASYRYALFNSVCLICFRFNLLSFSLVLVLF